MQKIDNGVVTFLFREDLMKEAELFFNCFRPINSVFALNEIEHEKYSEENRTCKFCNKKFPNTRFTNIAHKFPEFLGNKGAISLEECDSCNKYFGKLEKQLFNFIGFSPTMSKIKGKKKIPNQISYKNELEIKPFELFETIESIKISKTNKENNSIVFDSINKGYKINFITQPYVPISVYKCLLKYALDLLPLDRQQDYLSAFNFLLDRKNKLKLTIPMLQLVSYNMNTNFSYSGAILFDSINKDTDELPLNLVFFFTDQLYQIYIPFSHSLLNKLSGRTINLPLFPPPFPNSETETYDFSREDFNLNKEKSETRNINLFLKPNNLDLNKVSIDLTTRKVKDSNFDFNNITEILLVPKGTTIQISE